MIHRLKNIIFDILFPHTCLTCSETLKNAEHTQIICGSCFQSIPLYDSVICPVCLRRMPGGETTVHPHARYLLAAATHYGHEKVQKLIWQFKYKNWLSAAEPIQSLFTGYLRRLPHDWSKYVIVSMPLHPRRELKRGFNQAAVLAHAIRRTLYMPILKDNLVRAKDTKPQAEQSDYTAREKNMAGAFHILRPEEFKNTNILLVDDVWTSGATLTEAVRVLQASGAQKIVAAVVARAR